MLTDATWFDILMSNITKVIVLNSFERWWTLHILDGQFYGL